MKVIVDTNIAFSAICNSNGKIARIMLHPKSKFNFYSTTQLLNEIDEHSGKLKKLTKFTDKEFSKVKRIIVNKIRFINPGLIPVQVYKRVLKLTSSVDIDDTEFVALAEHLKGKLWTGDKVLSSGLMKVNWNRFITTDELLSLTFSKKA